MTLEYVLQVLEEAIGLSPTAMGRGTIQAAVERRKRALKLECDREYCRRLASDTRERKHLTEEVVVPETSFFRYPQSFQFLISHLRQNWVPVAANRVLRILSLPCSTGEEPYSLAISLLEAGFRASDFQIDAVDVSPRAIETARAGIYGRGSFRNQAAHRQTGHFEEVEGGLQLRQAVRESVNFHLGNILDRDFTPPAATYQVVLCRNLLIYFSRANRDVALQRLTRVVEEGGLLMLGHGEAYPAPPAPFRPVREVGSFAFIKQADAPRPAVARCLPRAVSQRRPQAPLLAPRPIRPVAPTSAPAPPTPPPPSLVDQARAAADRGLLVEAAEQCEQALAVNGRDSEALFLLGLVSQSLGATSLARKNLEQVLELDPEHHDALVALALLADGSGDRSLAKSCSQRAAELRASTQPETRTETS